MPRPPKEPSPRQGPASGQKSGRSLPPLSRAEVIAAIRDLYREGRPYSGAPVRLSKAAAREFGTWTQAVVAATTTGGTGAITRADVLDVLTRLAAQRPTMTMGLFERSHFAPAVRRHFSSVSEAANAAGLVGWPLVVAPRNRSSGETAAPAPTRRVAVTPAASPDRTRSAPAPAPAHDAGRAQTIAALHRRFAAGQSVAARDLQIEAPDLYREALRHGWVDVLYLAINGPAVPRVGAPPSRGRG